MVLDPDLARRAAEAVDAAVARGDDPGPLAGVPFGVKDLEDCAGHADLARVAALQGPPAGDRGLAARRPAPRRRRRPRRQDGGAGVRHASPSPRPRLGHTRNPWNTDRTPGGSSGGSAAAVAAGIVPFGTASDGGGSTRIPAAFTGLVGMKPSHGRIPHPPATTSQTSVFGALTTTVADTARHLDVVAGPDDRDRLSLPAPTLRYEDAIESFDVARPPGALVARPRFRRPSTPRWPKSPRPRPASWPTPPGLI